MADRVHDLAQELMKLRKNPVLLLDCDITHSVMLKLESELSGHQIKELDAILQTGGGSIEAAYGMTKILRQCAKKLNIIVPLFAKSAGTFICLAGDRILLSGISELGPLDPQMPETQEGDTFTHKSALNGFKALDQLLQQSLVHLDMAAKFFRHDMEMKMSDVVKHAVDFVEATCGQLYAKMNPKEIGEYARELEVGEAYGLRLLTKTMGWDKSKATQTIRIYQNF